ncbi:hypothetical protein [Gramella sp. MAR_2010_147]|uniref:hypothetical protein n=1 Tax=Gramella sp. MAR_2010_147 TaxID=1250205 RepID=UPI000B7FF42B|nr:hypothetical protein [Gramella sp. MAR_2010_147]
MKTRNHFLFGFFLLQVLFLTSATSTFAYPQAPLDLDSRQGEFLKTDLNKKAVIIEERLSEASFQFSAEDETNTFYSFSDLLSATDQLSTYSENKLSSEYKLNIRNLLKTQLFPFHSFW